MEVAVSADDGKQKRTKVMTLKEAHERFQVQGIYNAVFNGDPSCQEGAFKNCVAFLEDIKKAAYVERKHSSYGLKHLVEQAFQACYVSEATFILAALSMGFTHRHLDKKTMSCCFNLSSRAVDNKGRQLNARHKIAKSKRRYGLALVTRLHTR